MAEEEYQERADPGPPPPQRDVYAERRAAVRGVLGKGARALLGLSKTVAREGYESVAHDIDMAVKKRQQGRKREATELLQRAAEKAEAEGVPRPEAAKIDKAAERSAAEAEGEGPDI